MTYFVYYDVGHPLSDEHVNDLVEFNTLELVKEFIDRRCREEPNLYTYNSFTVIEGTEIEH